MSSSLVFSEVGCGQPDSANVASHQARNIADTRADIRSLPCWRRLLMLSFTILLCNHQLLAQPQPKETTASVGTVSAVRKSVEKTQDLVGRVEAINRVV